MPIIRSQGKLKIVPVQPDFTFPIMPNYYKLPVAEMGNAATYFQASLEPIPYGGRNGIRVVNVGPLPDANNSTNPYGNAMRLFFYHYTYAGTDIPANPKINKMELTSIETGVGTDRGFSFLLDPILPSTNYVMWLGFEVPNTDGRIALPPFQSNIIITPAFDDVTWRTLNAIDGTYGVSGATGGTAAFYRGSIDTSTLTGAPNIDCLEVQSMGCQEDANYWLSCLFNYKLQPTSLSDNLDSMKYAKLDFFPHNGASSPIDTLYVQLSDRLYATATSSDAVNATYGSFVWKHKFSSSQSGIYYYASSLSFYGHIQCQIFNVYGGSAGQWCHGGTTVGTWEVMDTTAPTGAPAPPSGGGRGGGGGGSCPAPEIEIETSLGPVAAGDMRVGLFVPTFAEGTKEFGHYRVTDVEWDTNDLWTLTTTNGHSLRFAPNHKFLTYERGWTELQHLHPGDCLFGTQPTQVREVAFHSHNAPVVKITVADAHTYITSGILSHNMKASTA